jgi:hypothetical protein
MPARASRWHEAASANEAGSGERSGHGAEESRVNVIGHRANPLGDIICSRLTYFEQSQEQGSATSLDVEVAKIIEEGMGRILV